MKISKIVAGAALAVSLATGAAQASPTLNGTAAVSVIGVGASDVSIGLGTVLTNTIFSTVGGVTGDFASAGTVLGTIFTTNPITATLGSLVSFASSFGSFNGTIQSVTATGPATNRHLDFYALGVFNTAGVLSGFANSPMSVTFGATQTTSGGSVSASYTLASPPAVSPVPEPMSLALFGTALAGLGLVRRRA